MICSHGIAILGLKKNKKHPGIALLTPVRVSVSQDSPSFVEKRLSKLLDAGVVSALVCMVKHESPALTESCRECIAR